MRDYIQKVGLMVLMSFFVLFAVGQSVDGIKNGFSSGSASVLAKNFDNNVEVTILTKESNYSKSQAEMVLKDFFGSHKPSGYKLVHSGDSGSGAKYEIGELATSSGTYRTYVYYKINGGSYIIQEIRIENN